jgi:hypothetical protein
MVIVMRLAGGSWQGGLFLHVVEELLLEVIRWGVNGVREELCDFVACWARVDAD